MLEEAAPSLSCSCWGDMGVSGAESAGRGNRALTKDPGRKSRVCIKTSVQVKLKEGLRELWRLPLLGWGGPGREEEAGCWPGNQWCSWQWVETGAS